MTTYQIIELVSILGVFFLLAVIKFSIPSYFKKKGENFADKQDIQLLTEKVESIKSSFNEKIEILKSELNFKNQNRISVKAYEREALLLLNEKYSEWLNQLMNISFSLTTLDNYRQLENYFIELRNAKINYENAEAKLLIFMNDDEFLKTKTTCYLKTLELEHLAKNATNNLQKEFGIIDIYFSNLPTNTIEEIEFKQHEFKEAFSGVSSIVTNFYQERANLFQEIHEKRVLFVNLLQKRLLIFMEN